MVRKSDVYENLLGFERNACTVLDKSHSWGLQFMSFGNNLMPYWTKLDGVDWFNLLNFQGRSTLSDVVGVALVITMN